MTEIYTVSETPAGAYVGWPAVFAGAIVAAAIGAMLNLLGVALGAGAFNPYDFSGGDRAGFTVAAGVWVAVMNAIALFFGALLASRAAQVSDGHRGMLRGLVVWGLAFGFAIVMAGWMSHGSAPQAAAAQVAAQTASAPVANPAVADTAAGQPRGVLQSDGTYLQPDGTVTDASGAVVGHAGSPPQGGAGQYGAANGQGTPVYAGPPANAASAPAPTPQKAVTAAATVGLWAFITMLLGAIGAILGGRYGARPHAWERTLAEPDRIRVP